MLISGNAACRLELSEALKFQLPEVLPPSERSKVVLQTFKSACMFDTVLCPKHSITRLWNQIHITRKELIALEWIIMTCTNTLVAVDSTC